MLPLLAAALVFAEPGTVSRAISLDADGLVSAATGLQLEPADYAAVIQVEHRQGAGRRHLADVEVLVAGKTVTTHRIVSKRFRARGGYQRVLVPFQVAEPGPVDIRVTSVGRKRFEVGSISVTWASQRRPFYVIAHCTNSARRVQAAIEQGANAVELDLQLADDGRIFAKHGGGEPIECGGRAWPDEMPELFELLRTSLEGGELALLLLDTKGTEGREVEYGRALGETLAAAKIPPNRVVVSVPLETGGDVFDGLALARYSASSDLYLSDYGTTEPGPWVDSLVDHGTDFAGLGMDPIGFWRPMRWWGPWMRELANRRDANNAPPMGYYWTLNRKASARLVLDHMLDGMITNHPKRMRPILDEPPYRSLFVAGTHDDELVRHGPTDP